MWIKNSPCLGDVTLPSARTPLRGKRNYPGAGRWYPWVCVEMDMLGCSAPEEVSIKKTSMKWLIHEILLLQNWKGK